MIDLDQKTSNEISLELAAHVRTLRKQQQLTQAQLAKKSGTTLASYKRFEQRGLISLHSLINIAIALDCENDFDALFLKPPYTSIEEVINDAR